MENKIINNDNLYIINSNYDYNNQNQFDKTNINNNDYLDSLKNDSILVIRDSNLAGYITFLEGVEKYNNKNPSRNIYPVVSIKLNLNNSESFFYCRSKDDVQSILKYLNPISKDFNNINLLNNIQDKLDEENYLLFKSKDLYSDLLDIKVGHFSPKYSGQYESQLDSLNNFESIRDYLYKRVEEKLNIDINESLDYKVRIDEEINVLSGGNQMKQNFLEYMFVVSDIVQLAKENEIRVGPGRGSGAGSLTAYLLNITEIDPIIENLSFERFLNKDRPSFPDFDLDFDSSKLNILKSLIKDKLGYSIIQMGTLNSHSINDFLPSLKKLTFLTEEQRVKIFFEIKKDFEDPRKKDEILQNKNNYIINKLDNVGININKINNSLEMNILKKFNIKSVNTPILNKMNKSEFKSFFSDFYNENDDCKDVLSKIGFNNLNPETEKTNLMRAIEFKEKLIQQINLFDKDKLSLVENKFQEKLFNQSISGSFFNYIYNEKQITGDEILDFDIESLNLLNEKHTLIDLDKFTKYKDYILNNMESSNSNYLFHHENYIKNMSELNKGFHNSIYNFTLSKHKDAEIQINSIKNLFESIDRIKLNGIKELKLNQDILNLISGENGIIKEFSKNFDMYKGLGSHASGHIIVDNKQIKEMAGIFPVLKQDSREPVMGVNHKMVESLGGVKFDLLGLKTLTVHEVAKKLSGEVFKNEYMERGNEKCEKIINFLSEDRDFSFIFQAEGVEIKTALNIMGQELKRNPDMKLIDGISNIIALARPGPIANGTLYDYLSNGKKTIENFDFKDVQGDKIHEISDKISKCLDSTNGYLIYQEQIIDIAKIIGLSGGEADNFRRAISKKDVELLSAQESIFKEKGLILCENNCVGNEKYLESVFKNLASFAEYGFNKSHSVSYANLLIEGAFYATEKPKEYVNSLFSVYGGEIGSLDGISGNKEVLKSNSKIPSLISFAGSLGVNIQSYWDNKNINIIDIDKQTDKDNKVMSFIDKSNNSLVLSSKILNSKNHEKLEYKECWAKGKLIGSGELIDISNLKFGNLKNYLIKPDSNNLDVIATFVKKGNNGGLNFSSSTDNGKNYTIFPDKSLNHNMFKNLESGDSVKLNVNLTENKNINKVFCNFNSLKKIESEELLNVFNKNNPLPLKEKEENLNFKAIDEILFDL